MTETPTAPVKGWSKYFLYLLGVWLVARLLFSIPLFNAPDRVRLIENNTYLDLAENLVARGVYTGTEREDLDLVRTPIYPYFIAVILELSNSQLQYLALVQILLSAGTCLLIYLGTRLLFNEPTALAAAWLFALDPNALYFSLTALTETLFVLWLALALYLLAKYVSSKQLKWIFGSAIFIGVATLTRPIAVWLIPIWTACSLWPLRAETPRKKVLTGAGIVALAWFVFLPWQLRNYAVSGQFSLSPVGQDTIENWIIAEGLAEARGITRNQAATEITKAPDSRQFILEILKEYPGPVLIAQIKGIYRTFMGFEYDNWMAILGVDGSGGRALLDALPAGDFRQAWDSLSNFPRGSRLTQLTGILWGLSFNALLYGSALIGAVTLLQMPDRRWVLALVLLMAAYLLLGPAAAGQARFRVPAMPALVTLGGLGISVAVSAGQVRLSRYNQARRASGESEDEKA